MVLVVVDKRPAVDENIRRVSWLVERNIDNFTRRESCPQRESSVMRNHDSRYRQLQEEGVSVKFHHVLGRRYVLGQHSYWRALEMGDS